jgi:hypothetical protein
MRVAHNASGLWRFGCMFDRDGGEIRLFAWSLILYG